MDIKFITLLAELVKYPSPDDVLPNKYFLYLLGSYQFNEKEIIHFVSDLSVCIKVSKVYQSIVFL